MSQITRCPSCGTSFKVVADQLRISEGWVRCGQCKEVFDASAHLLPAAPPPLLPDVSLTDVKPPTAPVARANEAGRAWGGPSSSSSSSGSSTTVPPSGLGAAMRSAQQAGTRYSGTMAPPADTAPPPTAALDLATPVSEPPFTTQSPVLNVPTPAVPAFLAAGTSGARGELSIEPVTPFAWRAPLPPPTALAPNKAHTGVRDEALTRPFPTASQVSVPAPASSSYFPARELPPPMFADTLPAPLDMEQWLGSELLGGKTSPVFRAEAAPVPGGYELPFAELRDSGWPADVLAAGEASSTALPATVDTSFPAIDPPSPVPPPAHPSVETRLDPGWPPAAVGASPQAAEDHTPADLPPVDFLPPQRVEGIAEPFTPASDDSAGELPPADVRATATTQEAVFEDADPEHEHDVSFVRAARRQAFWRRPVVRVVLTLVALTALVVLALQMAVQERDRFAAMDARARPWLEKLCVPLQCEIAPRREIADVVIDSSSFNKARGDSYQLALTMKSQSSLPLAVPAIELTLTDAQDQPVLRRVLLPTDMAAPAELPARGEWSASVAVIVTTGGARVAGYRVLAFYP